MYISNKDQATVLSALSGRALTVKDLIAATRLSKHDLEKARLILGARDEIRERQQGGRILVYKALTTDEKEALCAVVKAHQPAPFEQLVDATKQTPTALGCILEDLEKEGLVVDDTDGYRLTTETERKLYAIRVARIPDAAKLLEYINLKKGTVTFDELIDDLKLRYRY